MKFDMVREIGSEYGFVAKQTFGTIDVLDYNKLEMVKRKAFEVVTLYNEPTVQKYVSEINFNLLNTK